MVRSTQTSRLHRGELAEYDGVMKVDPAGRCESARDLAGDRPPTDDDVSITRDGRRLDTPAKVIAFLDEINSQRTPTASGV